MIFVYGCHHCGAEGEIEIILEDFVDYLSEEESLELDTTCKACECFIGLNVKFSTCKERAEILSEEEL